MVVLDEAIDLDSPDWADVNIVTGCLKLYLRELPDPLVPFRMYKPFIDAASESLEGSSTPVIVLCQVWRISSLMYRNLAN